MNASTVFANIDAIFACMDNVSYNHLIQLNMTAIADKFMPL
jgi:hypothetical protein